MRRTHVIAAAVAVAGVGLTSAFARAQETGGILATFGLTSTLRGSDNLDLSTNPKGGAILSETRLSFGLESVTRGQALRLSVSESFRAGDGPDAPVDSRFSAPRVALSYLLDSPDTRLTVEAELTTRDLDGDLTPDDVQSGADLIADDGTRTTRSLDIALATGRRASVGTDLHLSEFSRDYTDTTDPDLYDSQTWSAEAGLILRPDNATDLRLGVALSRTEAEDAVRTASESREVSLGVSRRLDPETVVAGSIGWGEVAESWRLFGLDQPRQDGLTASASLLRERATGTVSAALDHSVTAIGGRSDVTAGRSFVLPAGELGLSLGATLYEGDELRPTARLSFGRDFPGQSLAFGLSSHLSLNDDDAVERLTTLDVGYRYEMTKRDRLALSMDISWIEDDGSAIVTDRTRASATARYSRALTEDWALSAGYTHRLSREEGEPTAQSNAVFVTIDREFAWRPW